MIDNEIAGSIMTEISILRVPANSYLCDGAFALRHEVFVVEQQVPETIERDDYDLTATHFVAIAGGNVVGTLRVVFLAEHAKIGRVAVKSEWRGQGIGKQLMAAAMHFGRKSGENRFFLTAQADKVGLYEKLGFVAFGAPFVEAGMQHLAMSTYGKR